LLPSARSSLDARALLYQSPGALGSCSAYPIKSDAKSGPPSASRLTTMMESSPAIVPKILANLAWSIAAAKNCAAPGGVRKTAMFADPSADNSNSLHNEDKRASVVSDDGTTS